jgi:cytochrome c oxidase subunit 2
MEKFLAQYMPPDYSAHGPALDQLNAMVHWLMLILFVIWGAYFLFVLRRFRASQHPKASYTGVKSHVSSYGEIAVAVVEVILLVGFSIPMWSRWTTVPDRGKNPLEVRVVAEQFAWNIQYPGADGIFGRRDIKLVTSSNPLGLDPSDPRGKDDVVTLNQLHMQVGRPMLIHLSSKDVIHSFFLPYMRVKQDAIPGIEVAIHFTPVKEGEKDFEIACAQLCGLGHYRMRGQYAVHNKAGFDRWLAENAPQKTTAVAVTAPVPAPAAGTSPARSSIQPVS